MPFGKCVCPSCFYCCSVCYEIMLYIKQGPKNRNDFLCAAFRLKKKSICCTIFMLCGSVVCMFVCVCVCVCVCMCVCV